MPRWARSLALIALLVTAPTTAAQGLVQVSLGGVLGQAGGAFIELEVAALNAQGQRLEAVLHAHLAQGTTAAELSSLMVHRMQAAGLSFVRPPTSTGRRETAQLFVESVTFVHLRLGGGLTGDITLCDERPTAVRFLPPSVVRAPVSVAVYATTRHPHTRERGSAKVSIEAAADASSVVVAEALVQKAIRNGWVAARPTLESWSPVKLANGHEITGCSIALRGTGDWGIEVEIEWSEER